MKKSLTIPIVSDREHLPLNHHRIGFYNTNDVAFHNHTSVVMSYISETRSLKDEAVQSYNCLELKQMFFSSHFAMSLAPLPLPDVSHLSPSHPKTKFSYQALDFQFHFYHDSIAVNKALRDNGNDENFLLIHRRIHSFLKELQENSLRTARQFIMLSSAFWMYQSLQYHTQYF